MTSPGAAEPPGDLERTRRRVVASSARSLLLTVLGEFAYPTSAPTWTAVLVEALSELGVEHKTARQALARTAAEELITPERVGRRVRWSVTERGARLLHEGTQRIYSFMRSQPRWDGRWLVLSVTLPETQRQARHRLRTRLSWAGLGSPSPGLWVVPSAEKDREVAAILADLGIEEYAHSWVGPSGSVGQDLRLVAAAWRLDEVERAYQEFLSTFADPVTGSEADAFRAQVLLVHQWRRFPFLDPALPPSLLDHDWPGPRAAQVFRTQHDAWAPLAQRYWTGLLVRAANRA